MALDLVTGFPGFIGRRLVRGLLDLHSAARVVALVEPRMVDAAQKAADDLGADRIEILPGDISERRLGLSDENYERLRADITGAHHLAAIYNLAVPLELARRVNVDGTGNVLDLCSGAERLGRLNYVSTAYVAGKRKGVVYEHELALGQDFKNHYESTKFQAELWVREKMDKVPVTIYRSAIVVGDSRTGETQKFDGPYYMLRLIALSQQRGMPIPQFGRAAAPFNVVPVDFVVDALLAGASDERAVGETLHLVDPEPVTAAQVLTTLAAEYAGKQPAYRMPPGLVQASLRFAAVRNAFSGTPQESIQYLNHPVRFDTRRAQDLLERSGLRCPRFEEYVGPMVSFFKQHEDDASFQPAG